MDRPTVDLYDREAARYLERRRADDVERVRPLTVAEGEGPVLDAGCGPGIYLPHLGSDAVGLDAAGAMLGLARRAAPAVPVVQADLVALPFRRRAFRGAWARKSYLHVRRADLPMALADLHRALGADATLVMAMLQGSGDGWQPPLDDLPGRFFAAWSERDLRDVLEGGGFAVVELTADREALWVTATRATTLADTVGPRMRVLICGLNPSLHAAEAGVAYAGPGNRFWPAAVEAGLVRRGRDPWDALQCGVGFTDLVKRSTRTAREVHRHEYRAGVGRVARLVAWLKPRAVCFVGLAGFRAAVDAGAKPGWQSSRFAAVATYVMPSTSALNAATRYDEVVAHLVAVRAELG